MNNKIIAAGVVVALCAVALIGVGYAYTATVTSPDNDFSSSYIVVQAGDGVDTLFTNQKIMYDSSTVIDDGNVVVNYTTADGLWTSSEKKIKVTGTNDFSGQKVTVKVTIAKTSLTVGGVDYSKILYDNSNPGENGNGIKKASATLGSIQTSSDYNSSSDEIYWSFSNVPIGAENVLIINYISGQTFAGTLESGPANVLDIQISITATA